MGKRAWRPEESDASHSDSFAEIVERSEPGLRRLLGLICGKNGDVDDLVQETYLRAWRGFGRFRSDSGVTTWITRIAISVSRNWARSRRATVSLSKGTDSTPGSNPGVGEDAVRHAYEVALARLSPEQRTVFVLHETERLSYQEVAEVVGCPLGTVMSRLHRARALLLEALSEQIEELVP